jgi:hypothetical protein
VTGEARGSWYFEASFPVKVLDAQGNVLASGPAQAQGAWQTTDFVPFKITLTFTSPGSGGGTLRLQKDNPSGLPQNEDWLDIPVRFNASAKPVGGGCKPTGCSSEVCADTDMITACVYLPKYACYKDAKCERQKDGQCGWTPTAALTACLKAKA